MPILIVYLFMRHPLLHQTCRQKRSIEKTNPMATVMIRTLVLTILSKTVVSSISDPSLGWLPSQLCLPSVMKISAPPCVSSLAPFRVLRIIENYIQSKKCVNWFKYSHPFLS